MLVDDATCAKFVYLFFSTGRCCTDHIHDLTRFYGTAFFSKATNTLNFFLLTLDVLNSLEAIPGSQLNAQQGGYTFPQDAAMPEVSFYVGEAKITMAPETIAYGEPDADGNVFGSIQSSGDLGFAIFGDAFLKNCYG